MMLSRKLLAAAVALAVGFALIGCQAKEKAVDLSNYDAIAEYSALECYYHNVVEVKDEGITYLFGAVNVGYKKAWFEYRGSVKLGIDFNELGPLEADSNGVVNIELPEIKVLGKPDFDEGSMSEVYADKGIITDITNEDMNRAIAYAQNEMKTEAENDESLRKQAEERVKVLLTQYVTSVGKASGRDLKVNFVNSGKMPENDESKSDQS